jgi:hypothetical protein
MLMPQNLRDLLEEVALTVEDEARVVKAVVAVVMEEVAAVVVMIMAEVTAAVAVIKAATMAVVQAEIIIQQ